MCHSSAFFSPNPLWYPWLKYRRFSHALIPLWNKVSNCPPWNWQGLFSSMSPLMLNHRRPPPTNPSAEIPGFVDLSHLIDTKWSVSLLMNLWNQVVTIYFIPYNFFQTVLPCLSLCLTWVLITGSVMCLNCRHPPTHTHLLRPHPRHRTQSKGRLQGSLRHSVLCLVELMWARIAGHMVWWGSAQLTSSQVQV